MAQPPDTMLTVSADEAEAIRQAVRRAVATPYGAYRCAQPSDRDALFSLLADPSVSGPLYTVPERPTPAWVAQWIAEHEEERARGEGLLLVARNDAGALTGFADIQVWPELSAAEMGGGIRADLQSAALGGRGAAALFDWLFCVIGVRLLAMTNALDNARTARLLAGLGFKRLSDRTCETAEGDRRPSMYWELRREDWGKAGQEEGGVPSAR